MRSSRFPGFKLLGGLLAGATALTVVAMAGPALAAPQARHPLHGSTPRWLHQARDLGTTSSSQQVNFGVLLGMRDEAGAVATLQAISDPSSASYGRWLSNAAFNSRYAPASSDVAAVQNWLRSQGFQVTTTLPSGMYVEASGSAAQVESTFATSLHNYSYLGKKGRANATALSLPASAPAAVSRVITGGGGGAPGAPAGAGPPIPSPGPRPAPGTGCSRARRTTRKSPPMPSPPPTASTSRTRPADTGPSSSSRPTARAGC